MAEGLQDLYQASYRRLVAQLAATTGDVAGAEDLVQEAFARALARWPQVRACESPEAWIRVVALNLARSKWRRATRGAAVMLRLRASQQEAPPPSPDHVTLVEAMRKLPAAQREALVLFHVADLSIDDIARQLDVPTGTVKARLSRGRAALAADLGRGRGNDRGGVMSDGIGDSMADMGRGVEAAVRVPPYEVVVKRLHRRRRRRVGVGGLALAALAAIGITVLPQATHHPVPTMQTAAVRVAPQTGPGTLTLDDVSFLGPTHGLALGRRCSAGCGDVTLSTADGGDRYGPEVTVPGRHRYVAAGRQADVVYAPDLAVRPDGAPTWTSLDVPAPVADIAVSGGTMTVLLVPPGQPAEIWTGPATPTSWSQFHRLPVVTGSDASARLVVGGDAPIVVSTSGTPRVSALDPTGRSVDETPLAVCGAGSRPSVSAVSATTWWVACRGQRASRPSEEVAVTTDGGRSFSNVGRVPSVALDLSVVGVSPATAYLYGGPALLVTHDGGATWRTALSESGLGAPHVPAGADGRDVWVVAPGRSTIYRTTGGVWTGLRLR